MSKDRRARQRKRLDAVRESDTVYTASNPTNDKLVYDPIVSARNSLYSAKAFQSIRLLANGYGIKASLLFGGRIVESNPVPIRLNAANKPGMDANSKAIAASTERVIGGQSIDESVATNRLPNGVRVPFAGLVDAVESTVYDLLPTVLRFTNDSIPLSDADFDSDNPLLKVARKVRKRRVTIGSKTKTVALKSKSVVLKFHDNGKERTMTVRPARVDKRYSAKSLVRTRKGTTQLISRPVSGMVAPKLVKIANGLPFEPALSLGTALPRSFATSFDQRMEKMPLYSIAYTGTDYRKDSTAFAAIGFDSASVTIE